MADWPHAPLHRFGDASSFFITGATYLKQHFYRDPRAMDELQEILFTKARQHCCWLQSWSLLSNHYHLVVQAENGEHVRTMVNRFHSEAALARNARDETKGRRVWFQY